VLVCSHGGKVDEIGSFDVCAALVSSAASCLGTVKILLVAIIGAMSMFLTVETGVIGLEFLFLLFGELGEGSSVDVHGVSSLRGSAASSSEWLSSTVGFHPKHCVEALFLVLFSIGLGVGPVKVRIADAFLHFCEGIGGVWIIVCGSEDVPDKRVLYSLFEEFYNSMAIDVKLHSCDKLFEPGDECVQVIAMPQLLKLAVGVILLVGVSEGILEIGFKGGPVSFICFWYIGGNVALK